MSIISFVVFCDSFDRHDYVSYEVRVLASFLAMPLGLLNTIALAVLNKKLRYGVCWARTATISTLCLLCIPNCAIITLGILAIGEAYFGITWPFDTHQWIILLGPVGLGILAAIVYTGWLIALLNRQAVKRVFNE